jgi:predicted secreted hydrolase
VCGDVFVKPVPFAVVLPASHCWFDDELGSTPVVRDDRGWCCDVFRLFVADEEDFRLGSARRDRCEERGIGDPGEARL